MPRLVSSPNECPRIWYDICMYVQLLIAEFNIFLLSIIIKLNIVTMKMLLEITLLSLYTLFRYI